jgi:type II secretory pathway component PulM
VREWFLGFRTREQIALLIMGAAVSVYALVLLLLLPLSESRRELAERNAATAAALARVDGLASEIAALRDGGAAARDSGGGANLTATVNRSAERFGLRPSRLQPNSSGGVQVRFEVAPLEALLRWLHELEASRGLVVEELSLSQTQTTGSVSATARISALP